MKFFFAIAALLTALLNAGLVFTAPIPVIAPFCTSIVALFFFAMAMAGKKVAPKQEPAPVVITAPPVPVVSNQTAEAELITLLGLMQEKGRFVDFLMEDITAYDDAQVGSVARIVHQGCREVISQHFEVLPISNVQEGEAITVPAGYSPTDYRLIGKVGGQPPFTGTLVHKGWKTASVKLPRVVKSDGSLPSITPAEVELK